MSDDIKRLIRHLVPVLVVYAVSAGWIPAAAQSDAIEVGLILAGIVPSLIWSRKRDQRGRPDG